LNRSQFSRVIGKGGMFLICIYDFCHQSLFSLGQTITHVRSTTGVFMRGSDIDEDNRLVLLHGTLDQVINAFDIITEVSISLTPSLQSFISFR
jgi:hypothetical protein